MEEFTEYMLENSFVFGVIALALSVAIFLYIVVGKESPKMKDHDIMSWKAYVNIWAVAAILLILGISLLLR